jgi:Peptidase family M1 domain
LLSEIKIMRNALAILALCLVSLTQLQAQNGIPIARNVQVAFDRGTRSASGQPGPKYWQNKANYEIAVGFTPENRLLKGRVTINYTNNSPDTLRSIHFKLYPNFYQDGVVRMAPVDAEDTDEGMTISGMSIGYDARKGQDVDISKLKIKGTEMSVPVEALLPGKSIQFTIHYSYTLNKSSHYRTGEIDEGAYFIAYFFPRIAVYDDIDGWNTNPYLGTQEFYNDFCNFDVEISVPKDYVVWGTGDFKNCGVLYDTYCERLALAESQDMVVNIIDTTDLRKRQITKPNAVNNFNFQAQNVTDFVFALSNHYVWQSTSLVVDSTTMRRTRVDAVFNPEHKDYYHVLGDAQKTVSLMSYRFPKWPFPYAHETVFDGLDQMEYPMMVNDNPVEDRHESIELTDHEIFHTMFPFYMGTNETKYAWMDEGWATIGEWLISPMIDSTIVDDYGMARYEKSAGTELDIPITTLSTQQTGLPFFTNSYPKPALGYLYVKDMLGDVLFTTALHHYIASWNGKHPIPNDFFNCMNAGAGQNMNWFWHAWFYEDGVPDLGIAKVTKKQVTIVRKGIKPVPVDLKVTYTDGSTETLHRSIAVWHQKTNETVIKVNKNKTISRLELGSTYVPDVNRMDNVYQR